MLKNCPNIFIHAIILFLATSTAVCLKMNDHAEEPGGGPLRTTRNAQKKDTESPRMSMAQSMYISTEAAKYAQEHMLNQTWDGPIVLPVGMQNLSSQMGEEAEQVFLKELQWIQSQSGQKACYLDVGCFKQHTTLTHPAGLPETPGLVETVFWLYSRLNPECPVFLNYKSVSGFRQLAQFATAKHLVIIVHGFGQNAQKAWVVQAREALLAEVGTRTLVRHLSTGG